MNQLYRATDIEEAVVEIECVEDLLVNADSFVGVGRLDEAMQCLMDAQKSVRALQSLQKKQTEYKRLEDLAKALVATGALSKVVHLHV